MCVCVGTSYMKKECNRNCNPSPVSVSACTNLTGHRKQEKARLEDFDLDTLTDKIFKHKEWKIRGFINVVFLQFQMVN